MARVHPMGVSCKVRVGGLGGVLSPRSPLPGVDGTISSADSGGRQVIKLPFGCQRVTLACVGWHFTQPLLVSRLWRGIITFSGDKVCVLVHRKG